MGLDLNVALPWYIQEWVMSDDGNSRVLLTILKEISSRFDLYLASLSSKTYVLKTK